MWKKTKEKICCPVCNKDLEYKKENESIICDNCSCIYTIEE